MERSKAEPGNLKELAILFLKLGTTTFGGPAAQIAMMQNEVVIKRKWISQEEFLDMLSAANFIPGPNSTEMAIHIGYRRGGIKGLLLAGILFILPAAIIVSIIADLYIHYGNLPSVEKAFRGIMPVIIAVVLQALFTLSKAALKDKALYCILFLSVTATFFGMNELLVLALAGVLNLSLRRLIRPKLFAFTALPAFTLAAGASKFSLGALFTFFLKVGSVLFGSGYVLLAFLRTDLVEKLHWLTDKQLLDATAVGQFTPGPVFTTATFIGYLLSGPMGAFVATVGIFAPAFFFVAISAPYISKIRQFPKLGAVLDGVNVASLALMVAVTWNLGRDAIVDFKSILITVISLGLLIRFRLNSAWLVLAGAAIGYWGI